MNSLLDALQASPGLFTATLASLGLLVGSFLNVVIARLPRMLETAWRDECSAWSNSSVAQEQTAPFNLVSPRSRCPHCQTPIRAFDNIPVVSWLALRGRCRSCRAAIAWRYPLVEIAAAGLACLAATHFGPGLAAIAAAGFCWVLLVLAVIDLDTMLLPDDLTLPLLWAGLTLNLRSVFVPLETAVIGALAGYLCLWLVYWGFKLATGKEGMGHGDFKLLAALGAWLGWQALPVIVLSAAGVGAVVGLGLIFLRRLGRDKPIPFGPFLAAAGVIYLLWGASLQQWFIPGSQP